MSIVLQLPMDAALAWFRDAEWVRSLTAIMMTVVSEGQWKTGTFAKVVVPLAFVVAEDAT